MSEILIAGDFVPTIVNEKYFINGIVDDVFDQGILQLFREASYRVVNFEGVLTDSGNPISKSGPCLCASSKCQKGIQKLYINLFSLANNHIMDYGEKGLDETKRILQQSGGDIVGVGQDIESARKPIIFNINNLKVGILSCSEHEFGIATENSAGVNPFDVLTFLDDVIELKRRVDFVIVLYHGGKEYYQYPAPYLQKRCRRVVDKGANLVLCQHSHCIGCYEEYKDSMIVYGQGNFLMNRGENELRNTGLLIKICFERSKIEFIPVCKTEYGVRLANEEEKRCILEQFNDRSEKIKDSEFVINEYNKFAASYFQNYQVQMLGIVGRLLKKLGISKLFRLVMNEKVMCDILNILRCEAHNDLCITGIKQNGHIDI